MIKKSVLEYAFFLLSRRDYGERELKERLNKKGYSAEDAEKTIVVLKEKRFLDDEKFVTNFIRHQREYGLAGKYKIKFKLEQLKIERELIERKMAEFNPKDEQDHATKLALNWLDKKQSVPAEKRYEKLGRFLAAKGFEIGVVRNVLADTLKKDI